MNFGCVHDIQDRVDRERLEHWHAGRIVVARGRLERIERRLWGYRASRARVWWDNRSKLSITTQTHDDRDRMVTDLVGQRDECQLYYHHGWLSADFLVLGYVRSFAGATLSTFYMSLLVLDEIARIKRSHAIVAEVSNPRISDRLLSRWGWEQHCLQSPGRHFIKRFYGNYPTQPPLWNRVFDQSA